MADAFQWSLRSAQMGFLACLPPRYCWDDAALVDRSWKHPYGLTQAGSLIKYLVPRSSQLVVVECVRRALDGLSPLSGPTPLRT